MPLNIICDSPEFVLSLLCIHNRVIEELLLRSDSFGNRSDLMSFVLFTQNTVDAEDFLIVLAKSFKLLPMFETVLAFLLPLHRLPVLFGRRFPRFLLLFLRHRE